MEANPLRLAMSVVSFVFQKNGELVTERLPKYNKDWRNLKYRILPDYRKGSIQLSRTCKAKLKTALCQFQQVIDNVTNIDFEVIGECELDALFAEGRGRLKSQRELLQSTGNEAAAAFVDLRNLDDNERLTALSLAFACQLLLHVDDFKSLQGNYSYLLECLFKDVNLQGHIKGYMKEAEGKRILGKIATPSFAKSIVEYLKTLLDSVYAVVKQMESGQNREIIKKLINDLTVPSSLKEKHHNFITMHSISQLKLSPENGIPIGTSIFFEGEVRRESKYPERFMIIFQIDDDNIVFCYDVRMKTTKSLPTIFMNSCHRGKWRNMETISHTFQANCPFRIDVQVTASGLMIKHDNRPPHRFTYRDNLTPDKIREIVVRGHVDIKQHGYLGEEKQKTVDAIREPNYEKISMLCRAADAVEIKRCINGSTFFIDDPSASHDCSRIYPTLPEANNNSNQRPQNKDQLSTAAESSAYLQLEKAMKPKNSITIGAHISMLDIDGVPFVLNAAFKCGSEHTDIDLPALRSVDIERLERDFDYRFITERATIEKNLL